MEELLVASGVAIGFGAIYWYIRGRPVRIAVCEKPLGEYDYIIVGSGSSGSVVAYRLGEDPTARVLVLEAGDVDSKYDDVSVPRNSMALWNHPEAAWNYLIEPQKSSLQQHLNNQTYYWRGKLLGGCSSMNSMNYVRGNRDDYDGWARRGCTGWGYDDVLPYFKKSEMTTDKTLLASGFHGDKGPLYVSPLEPGPISKAFAAGMKEMGYRTDCLNGERQLGFMNIQVNIRDGERWSCVDGYLKPAVRKGNVDIVTNAHVTKIEIEDGRATGVTFVQGVGRRRFVRAKREVILSAGAIASPQILMLSGVGHKEHLEEMGIPVKADLPVGDNLIDHVGIAGPDFTIDKPITATAANLNSFWERMLYKLFKKGRYSTNGMVGNGFISGTAGRSAQNPDLLFMLYDSLFGSDPVGTGYMEASIHVKEGTLKRFYADRTGKDGATLLSYILKPKGRGTIRLRSRDPTSSPSIDPKLLEDEEDLENLVRGLEEIARLGETDALANSGFRLHKTKPACCSQFEWGSREYWKSFARNLTFHFCHMIGTCKMGPKDDATAVVDPQLRVRGIQGLRVVDASVIPDPLSANPHATCVMIGEKAADLIKGTSFA